MLSVLFCTIKKLTPDRLKGVLINLSIYLPELGPYLYDAIDILTERINRWDIFIQNHRDAVNLQLGIDSRNDLQQRLNTVMVRLMGYL